MSKHRRRRGPPQHNAAQQHGKPVGRPIRGKDVKALPGLLPNGKMSRRAQK